MKKICVITLTYNRPSYIERSFESLYKRAGCQFDHYVLDDCSNKQTLQVLNRLQKKYKFRLLRSTEKLGIFKCFYTHLNKIPTDYKYYVKFDSDVEILSDNLFSQLIENFEHPLTISGLTPRVEGQVNSDRYEKTINFFKGHAIKIKAPIVYGCCLVFPAGVFNTFPRMTKEQLDDCIEHWGVDSKLYDHALTKGAFLIIEDLSVYHIDNTYGQRRVYPEYFTDRKRWDIIDNEQVSYMNISKVIAPNYLEKEDYVKLRKLSKSYENFVELCLKFVKDRKESLLAKETYRLQAQRQERMIDEQLQKVEEEHQRSEKIVLIKKIYKITSPLNFPRDLNIEHGSFKYFSEIPGWAKNNPLVVIEIEEIKKNDESDKQQDDTKENVKLIKTKEIKNKRQKMRTANLTCDICKFTAKTVTGLAIHKRMKHN